MNTLAKEATDNLREAEEKFVSELARLYPVGSFWVCFHGSKNGYDVEVLGHSIHHGIRIKNIKTGKMKHVWWTTLQET